MILNLTQPRLYVCQYVNDNGEIFSYKFMPGDNKVTDSEAKLLLRHPGVKNRLDLGILVQKNRVTENLVEEATKINKKESGEKNHKAKKAEK